MPVPLPSAKASLENIRDRWIAAKTYTFAHIDAQRLKQRRQAANGYVTLAFAVITVPVTAVLPSFPAEQYAWAGTAAAVVAGITALSKLLEQRLVSPREIETHGSCIAGLETVADELNLLGAHVHEFTTGDRRLSLETVGETVRNKQAEIGELNGQSPARVADRHGARAREDYGRTSIHDALQSVLRRMQESSEPEPAGDLPEDAPGIVLVQAPRRRRP